MKDKELKVSYSTGSHAASAIKAALIFLFTENNPDTIAVTMPDGESAILDIDELGKTDNYIRVKVTKTDNDDIDATKGCKITCWIGYDLEKIPYSKHEIDHNPYEIKEDKVKLYIYAGKGLGVVTKQGLKPPVGFPAINPVPLDMIKRAFKEVYNSLEIKPEIKDIFAVFEVENGEEIAKNTANEKAGVLGGISFLGKKGIVKPISSDAYLDAIRAEVSVAAANPCKTIVMTMGNSSHKFASGYLKLEEECFIEIGNFVYDTLDIIKDFEFSKISIVANIGKLTKIAQARKNTNNRFGDIDFKLLKSWLKNFPEPVINKTDTVTIVGALEEFIIENYHENSEKFYNIIAEKGLNTLQNWCNELNMNNIFLEVVLTNGDEVKAVTNNKL